MQFLRETLLESEINRVRSHAERTVGRIERDLEVRNAADLHDLDDNGWLLRYWEGLSESRENLSYAAVVNFDGRVVLHSNPSRKGKWLARKWYDRVLFEVGEDVVKTRSVALAGGELSYDVRVPIEISGREVGDYHAGVGIERFEDSAGEQESDFVRRRSLLIGGVLLVVLLAATSLFYIARLSITLRREADLASLQGVTEVGKLAAGLAHEIRNPLHAIQLNLHSLRRTHEGRGELPPEEITELLRQSTREIERVEQLMQQLLGFATPDEPRKEVIDIRSEIQSVVDFLQQEMLDQDVEVQTRLPPTAVRVQMDHGRLRQIMLNLLQNAQQAMEGGGQIEVALSSRRGQVELTVADNGPGIAEENRSRIFEPFFSTKPDGTGFGLALVKRFVDEVNGQIHCESNPSGGVTFRIVLHQEDPPRRK